MRLQIGKIWLIAIIGIATASEAKAQLVSSNPLEWMALAEGNELINSEIKSKSTDRPRRRCCRIQWLLSLTRYTNGRRSTTAT